MQKATLDRTAARPHWTLLALEPVRACYELVAGMVSSRSGLPVGDGHPVVIFPGLAADSLSTRPLRQLCEQLGYATYDWGRGQNTGPEGDPEIWFDQLALDVRALIRPHAGSVSLIGWSLGGIYAREVAKRLGDAARQVITLGTPFAGTADETNAVWLYRLLNGEQPPAAPSLVRRVARAPAVPTTSIYTRSDGVVAWQACVQPGSNAHVDNIEVNGSHCGLGWNSQVLEIVAHKLKLHGRAGGVRRAVKPAKRGSTALAHGVR